MVSFPTVYQRVFVHWRAIILLLIIAYVAFLIASSDEFVSLELNLFALLLIFIASQIFWIGRVVDLGEWLLHRRVCRRRVAMGVVLAYLFVIAYSFPTTIAQGHTFRIGFYRLPNVVTEGVFWWWFVGSMLAFLLVIALGTADRVARSAVSVYRKVRTATHRHPAAVDAAEATLLSSGRRRFLERTAMLVSATPFVAAGYGLLYERQDVEVVRHRVRLARLPKAFASFRIAQLSDIHISPFTTADYIHRCVIITNELKPDLIALTGDYIAWGGDRGPRILTTI
jgi:hypothetical protein